MEIEASEWLVIMSDAGVSETERRRFQAWLTADPEHERVFQAQHQAWSLAGQMRHLLDRPTSARRGPRRVLERAWPIAAMLAVVFVGIIALQFGGIRSGERRFATEVAQIKELKLEDGSSISLGAASRIEVDFTSGARRVILLGGQAFFDVAHDPSRPFFVDAGATTVRVVGTQFDVNYATDKVRVSVLKGKVEVLDATRHSSAAADAPPPAQVAHALTAGQGAVSRA
ncbi:MAG TPA: FecR domain-containing protein, partial [Povalibacter sp.]|nr:FecR domain-containing protein [Povalibacter sp.]